MYEAKPSKFTSSLPAVIDGMEKSQKGGSSFCGNFLPGL